ncbi:rubrerythrin-like domain-containing protein [Candidatus Halobonum tyrrellensis]|nr:rubrerythrin-like domain-containing protein [Candidatus Halobonum tyrrellensis]
MRDLTTDLEEESPYECFECGNITVAEEHPGSCPDCGGAMRNRRTPLE